MRYTTIIRNLILAVLVVALPFMGNAQDANGGDHTKGKALFKQKCKTCHALNMKSSGTGPALGGVQGRWEENSSTDKLYAWINNSGAVIESGEAYAVQLFNDNNKSVMPAFPELSKEDITNILAFIEYKYSGAGDAAAATTAATETTATTEDEGSQTTNLIIIFGLLFLLVIGLARIVGNLNRLAEAKETGKASPRKSLMATLTSKPIIMIGVFFLVILGGYNLVNSAVSLNRQQAYAPQQPIKFSHELHAGKNKIDCQYCHDGARRSKHSVIPASNTCINCHKNIRAKADGHGTAEIVKIYAAAGFDPIKQEYFDANVSDEARIAVYKQYISNKEFNPEISEEEVDAQIEGMLASVKFNQPIEWVRIHNLPDHVYFNHAQHVVAGGVACQDCHGKVEEMEVLKQHSPLSMGWCINCHRETKVKFTENDYYKSYEKYHKELTDGSRSGVTVEEIGGLECQKCHY